MSGTIKTVIIDDEPLALKRLQRLLKQYDEIEIIGHAHNGELGLSVIEEKKPELVFLDVEMPGMNGFEMLSKLNHLPKIIFTTAFEEYAIKAFEENSVDYLLKPVETERLDKAIGKLKRFIKEPAEEHLPDKFKTLLHTLHPKKETRSIPVRIGDKILLIKTEDIVYFEAKDKYVYIVTDDNKEHLTDFTLAALEEKLSEPFVRIHRAFIINRDKIKELYRGFNSSYIVVMKDSKNTKINSGRSYNDNIKQLFEF